MEKPARKAALAMGKARKLILHFSLSFVDEKYLFQQSCIHWKGN
jgi:hypothetical protein